MNVKSVHRHFASNRRLDELLYIYTLFGDEQQAVEGFHAGSERGYGELALDDGFDSPGPSEYEGS